ncbi:T-box-containing protein TBX6L-like [Synchiropus picturatus]
MQHMPDLKTQSMLRPPQAAEAYMAGGAKMTLENADLWKSFHSIGTEMIITKHGRRMFPHCSVSISGLQPFANYIVMVDMVPVDKFKYKWKKEQWELAGDAEPQPPCRTYMHPDSPASGSHWMKQPLSFLKMKLTNHTLDQHGHIILHSMHRYYPRFHIIQADSPYAVRWVSYQTFSFTETTFTAVTAYQNPKITKLKIDHNPFAKGFREGGTHSHGKRCRSGKSPPAKKPALDRQRQDPCTSPSGMQTMPPPSSFCGASPSGAVIKNEAASYSLKSGQLSSWPLEHDPTESLHTEALELHEYDYSCEEQMVPVVHHPYRSMEYPRGPYPEQDAAQHTVQPAHHPLTAVDPQQHGYPHHHHHHHHGSTADWSQHPLFSYSCW